MIITTVSLVNSNNIYSFGMSIGCINCIYSTRNGSNSRIGICIGGNGSFSSSGDSILISSDISNNVASDGRSGGGSSCWSNDIGLINVSLSRGISSSINAIHVNSISVRINVLITSSCITRDGSTSTISVEIALVVVVVKVMIVVLDIMIIATITALMVIAS